MHYYEEKLTKLFSDYYYFKNFHVANPDGTTNIQTIFDLCPRVLKHVVGYCSHSIACANFQLLKIVVFDQVDDVLHTTPKEKKSNGVNAGDIHARKLVLLCRSVSQTSYD